MPLSVIIPVYNGIETLPRCLGSLKASTFQDFELLVVDDGSTDDSVAYATSFGAKTLTTNGRRGPAWARNVGAAAASGDVLVFLDADVAIDPAALDHFAAHFEQDRDLAAVLGSYDDAPEDTGWISSFKNLMHHFVHQQGASRASTFWSGLGAMRADVFRQHGGFDTSYRKPSIEDIELGVRVARNGYKILLDPSIQGKHLKTWTLGTLIRTDVFARGIPWTELILKTGHMPNDLNVSQGQRASVTMGALLPFAALGTITVPALAWLAVALLVLVGMVNREFYRFLAARRGWAFAIGTMPLHLLYFWYSGISFAAGVVLHLWKNGADGASKRESCA